MRRREPGFYVSVLTSAGSSGVPVELLDGPWPNKPAAERRAGEIAAQRHSEGSTPPVVQVADDGITILRELQEGDHD